jgi:hypothetical protein
MKRPSFQFYPGDWLNDAALRMVCVGARGLWIEMICIMHQGTEYGYLKVNSKVILNANLARMTGATLQEVEGWLQELSDAGVYSVDADGCIFSRRMIRDEEIRKARAEGGSKGGNPNLTGKNKVNLKDNLKPTPSSSSTSSSSSSNKKKYDYDNYPEFIEFWNLYPYKEAKGDAFLAWKSVNPPIQAVINALSWQINSDKWIAENGKYIPLPSTYINQRRWESEPQKVSTF